MTTPYAKELEAALAVEYAAGWFYYDEETRTRLGQDAARTNIDAMFRAIARAGLTLTTRPKRRRKSHEPI